MSDQLLHDAYLYGGTPRLRHHSRPSALKELRLGFNGGPAVDGLPPRVLCRSGHWRGVLSARARRSLAVGGIVGSAIIVMGL
jgi:hypothetical protein